MPRLVLCLMVRNEEKIIERCLRAALPLVDACVLSVNNTTDNTVAIARRVAGELDTPLEVIESVWKNFGANRTRSVADTKAWILSQGWDASSTYAILVDADHVLHSRPEFDRAQLTRPHYEIDTNDGRLRNPGTRVVRLSHDWKCIGVTHEYWASDPNTPSDFFPNLWVEDRADGGSKGDKLQRDVRLLKQGLKDEPGNGRYMFYLAESHYHLKQFKEAITWYERRIVAGGWDEEVWYSRYKIGLCLLELKKFERGAGLMLEAFEARPGRIEPLAALATHYRVRGMNHLTHMLAEHALTIPLSGDRLFVELDAHQRCTKEVAIASYYCNKPERGLETSEEILAHRGTPEDVRNETACNQTFYMRNIPVVRNGRFPIPDGLDEKYGMPYFGTNPTLVPHGSDYVVHVRLVNYKQTNGRYYEAANGVFRTRGAILDWNPDDGRLTQPGEVDLTLPDGWDETQINGLEDVRWVHHAGRVWFTATCCQVPGSGGWPRVVLGQMTRKLYGIERVMRLDYGKQGKEDREKNWIPWSRNGELLLIYNYDPFVVVRVNTETGECAEVRRWIPPFNATRWKGSAAPVPWKDGRWLMLVHETAYMPRANQWEYSIYSHRFVELAADSLTIVRYSRPFTWERASSAGANIEYAAGLARRGGSSLIVTYGVEDREAAWAEIDTATVESMLSEKS
jgi:glycosyltransferase involved in cell wall biosynthesis